MPIKIPRQFQLDPRQFPRDKWAQELVSSLNEFVTETIQALQSIPTSQDKMLGFTTGTVVSNSFPIDFPVEKPPSDIHIALVSGLPASAVTVVWTLLPTGGVRIINITGLAPNTKYAVRLACQ